MLGHIVPGAEARFEGVKVESGRTPGSPQKTPRTPATPVPGPPPPWPPGAPYPMERQISVRFPTVITPSEMAEHVKGDADPVKAADQYIGRCTPWPTWGWENTDNEYNNGDNNENNNGVEILIKKIITVISLLLICINNGHQLLIVLIAEKQ